MYRDPDPRFAQKAHRRFEQLMASNTNSSDCQLLTNTIAKALQYPGNIQCCDNDKVYCDASGHITHLYLNHSGMTGIIPSQLTQLTNLVHLNLSDNPFPANPLPNLGSLTNLAYLGVFGAKVTDSFPTWITGLTQLKSLNLHSNNLSGRLPDLSTLPQLFYLNVMSNKLTGAIPDLSALTNMNYLYLGFNNFQQSSFPTWLLGMTSLYDIILDNTVMPGTVFPDITRLVHLEYLSLSNCNISGPVTSDIQYLSNLQTLYLDHNDLSGSIPPEIANLKQLTALDLSHNHFEGTVPPAILQMPTYNSQNFQFSDQTPLPSTSGVGNLVYIVIAGGIILVLAIIGFAFYRNNQRKKQFPNYGFQNNQVSPQPLGQSSYPQPVYPNTAPANLPYGTAPQTVPQTVLQTAPYQTNSVPTQGIQQPVNALPMQPVYQTNVASPDAYLQNPSIYQNQNRLSTAGYDQYTQFSSSPIQPIMSPTQTVSSSFASSPIAFQESPNQGVNNYSPQRLSYVPSPQTPVGNDSPHGSQNSNSRISQVSPYQHVQPISAEIGQLPIISPPQSPYADLMSQQEITQPPVIEFQKHESTGLETAKIEVEDQPPLISKPF